MYALRYFAPSQNKHEDCAVKIRHKHGAISLTSEISELHTSMWTASSGWKLTISKIHPSQPTSLLKTWRFDLYQRPSSEQAGTPFFRFLTRQRARACYQMDQRGHTHPKGRTTGHEPWWGQLPTEPRIRPLSWHGVFPLCQEPKNWVPASSDEGRNF